MMNHFYSLDVAIQPHPSANALFSIMVGAVRVADSCSSWRATFLLMAHLRHACCEMRCPGSPYHAEAPVIDTDTLHRRSCRARARRRSPLPIAVIVPKVSSRGLSSNWGRHSAKGFPHRLPAVFADPSPPFERNPSSALWFPDIWQCPPGLRPKSC